MHEAAHGVRVSRRGGVESSRVRKAFLAALVVAQSLVSVGYGVSWMYYAQARSASATLGLVAEFDDQTRIAVIASVEGGGPAWAAGLVAGDRIRSADGVRLDTRATFLRWDHSAVGEDVALVVLREGGDAPVWVRLLQAVPFSLRGLLQSSLLEVLAFYPVVFLGVGLAVLALRPRDPHAWLMAMLFSSFLAVPAFPRATSGLPQGLAAFVLGYRAVALPAIPALVYAFFTLFPVRSPIDQRLPWLKWLNCLGVLMFGVSNITVGAPVSPPWLIAVTGPRVADVLRLLYLFGGIPLGVAALWMNAWQAGSPDARRKARVLVWGTAAGALPLVVQSLAQTVLGWPMPAWVSTAAVALSSVLPLSFAYAVVKHRVLDIPVLLKRSARYLLVRRGLGVLLLALAALLTAIFTTLLGRVSAVSAAAAPVIAVAFGVALALGSLRLLRQATRRIDRVFFRHAYNAAEILQRLADRIRTADSRAALADLLSTHISEALQPAEMAVFLENGAGALHPYAQRWPFVLDTAAADAPWVVELRRRGKVWDVSSHSAEAVPALVRESKAELLVPILFRDGTLAGYLLLGSRRSEEPYSGEDRRLLTSVANQAGVELENISLAEAMAERLDAQRAAERELEIARQVQVRLFPQTRPAMRTLDYAGGCAQARHVGGDYYDFLLIAEGRLALVVADTSGKGMGAALLMAHLQANLRAQYRAAPSDLPGLLAAVNRQFYENSAGNQYATLVFLDYADDGRRLRVVNCGHFPAYLLRAGGGVEALASTATVLGLFPEWTTPVEERTLAPGDQIVLYSDGVIEARNAAGEEFGDQRLLDAVRAGVTLPVDAVVAAIHDAVREFCGGHPEDDVTVVLARVK